MMEGSVDERENTEVIDCLLTMPKTQNDHIGEIQFWQNCQNVYQEGEQIIWKLDGDGSMMHSLSINKPLTFVVTQNIAPEAKQDVNSTQNKVVVIQGLPQQQNTYVDYCIVEPGTYSEANNYVALDEGASASKTDSSMSETVEVDVEDIGEEEALPFQSKFVLGLGNVTRNGKKRKTRGKKKIAKKITAGKPSSADKKSSCSIIKSSPEGPKPERNQLNYNELTKLEDNAGQVAERLALGCECSADCYVGLSADKVFRHRLNIADLTKAEHDMYLMGVILASMQNPDETSRKKERLRMRTTYSYHGKKVCLAAFLYLEHVTLYQLKRIRKHLTHHGVSPRIHGNHGRKPSNTLPLTIYQNATDFVNKFIRNGNVKTVYAKSDTGKSIVSYKLPPDCTRRIFHNSYKRACQNSMPSDKFLQYSTFTTFLKKQFPNVKFRNRGDKSSDRRHEDCAEVTKEDKTRKCTSKSKKMAVVPVSEDHTIISSTMNPVPENVVSRPYLLVESRDLVLEDSYILQTRKHVPTSYIATEPPA